MGMKYLEPDPRHFGPGDEAALALTLAEERSAFVRAAGWREMEWRVGGRRSPDVCGCGDSSHHRYGMYPHRQWLDHPYRIRRGDQEIWVSEPYISSRELEADPDLERLRREGWEVLILPEMAIHFPGATTAVWIMRGDVVDLPLTDEARLRVEGETRRIMQELAREVSGPKFEKFQRDKGEFVNQGTYVRVYRTASSGGNGELAIETNATVEHEFMAAAPSALLAALKARDGDEQYALSWLLPALVDIVCKLRGYKAELVKEQRVLLAGSFWPSESQLLASTEPRTEEVGQDQENGVVYFAAEK